MSELIIAGYTNAYSKAKKSIESILGSSQLTLQNFNELIRAAMEAVESTVEFVGAGGDVKATTAKKIIVEIIDELGRHNLVKPSIIDTLKLSIDLLAVPIFTAIISASKGNYNLGTADSVPDAHDTVVPIDAAKGGCSCNIV